MTQTPPRDASPWFPDDGDTEVGLHPVPTQTARGVWLVALSLGLLFGAAWLS